MDILHHLAFAEVHKVICPQGTYFWRHSVQNPPISTQEIRRGWVRNPALVGGLIIPQAISQGFNHPFAGAGVRNHPR